MLLSFVYLAFVSMLKLFVRRHPEHLKDMELMVLRLWGAETRSDLASGTSSLMHGLVSQVTPP